MAGVGRLPATVPLSRGISAAALITLATVGLILLFGKVSTEVERYFVSWHLLRILSLAAFMAVELPVVLLVGRLVEGERSLDLHPGRTALRTWLYRGIGIGIIANGLSPAVLSIIRMGWLTPLPPLPVSARLAAAIAVPLSAVWEEIVYRGYLLRLLRPTGTLLSLVLSTLVFSGVHFLAEPLYPDRFLVLFGMGILLGTAYMVSGSLWFSIGTHCGLNLVGFLLTSDPYAGGIWQFFVVASRTTYLTMSLAGIGIASLFAARLAVVVRRGSESSSVTYPVRPRISDEFTLPDLDN